MILVDTSVWIDHLHRAEPRLGALLEEDRVVAHDGVIEEIALGFVRQRGVVIGLLDSLRRAPSLGHEELLTFVERQRLWGRGLGVTDVQLLGSSRIARLELWTRDKRLRAAAVELGVGVLAEPT